MTTVSSVDPVAGRLARWVLSQPSGRVVAMSVVTMATVTAAAYVPFVWLLVTAFYDSRAGSAAAGAALVFNTAVTAVVLPRPSTELSQIRTWIDGDRSHPSAALRASFAYQRMVLRRAVPLLVGVYAFVMPPLVAWLADLTTVETVMYALLNLTGALTAPSLLSATSNLFCSPRRRSTHSLRLRRRSPAAAITPSRASPRRSQFTRSRPSRTRPGHDGQAIWAAPNSSTPAMGSSSGRPIWRRRLALSR